MTQLQPSRNEPEKTGDASASPAATRGTVVFIFAALAGSALLPFVQAITTKAGNDIYDKIRQLISDEHRQQAQEQLERDGYVTLIDEQAKTALRLPARMPPRWSLVMKGSPLGATPSRWRLIAWDSASGFWEVEEIAAAPPDALPTRIGG